MDLLSDPIGPTLKRLTSPVILGLLAMFSFSLADTFFVSLLGEVPLAAISFTFPVTFTLISLTIGLPRPISSMTASKAACWCIRHPRPCCCSIPMAN